MGVIEDLNRGVIDRFLVSPVKRPALITGRLVQLGIVSLIRSLMVIGLGLLGGSLGASPTAWPCWPARRITPSPTVGVVGFWPLLPAR